MSAMKKLIILRHAKAVSKNAPSDFERVLAARGQAQMKAVASTLADPALRPDLAFVSSAARTRETWARTGLADEVETRFEEGIYEASVGTLLDIVRGAPDAAGCVILVGHNPGLEALAQGLADREAGTGAALLSGGMPTAALAVLDFEVERWAEAGPGRAELAAFILADESRA